MDEKVSLSLKKILFNQWNSTQIKLTQITPKEEFPKSEVWETIEDFTRDFQDSPTILLGLYLNATFTERKPIAVVSRKSLIELVESARNYTRIKSVDSDLYDKFKARLISSNFFIERCAATKFKEDIAVKDKKIRRGAAFELIQPNLLKLVEELVGLEEIKKQNSYFWSVYRKDSPVSSSEISPESESERKIGSNSENKIETVIKSVPISKTGMEEAKNMEMTNLPKIIAQNRPLRPNPEIELRLKLELRGFRFEDFPLIIEELSHRVQLPNYLQYRTLVAEIKREINRNGMNHLFEILDYNRVDVICNVIDAQHEPLNRCNILKYQESKAAGLLK